MLGTPEDSWLRGEGISYYYFGYWNFALLTKLTGIVSSVTYNLSLALVPAMAALGMYGLVSNLIRAEQGKIKAAVLTGMVAALMLVFLANLEGAVGVYARQRHGLTRILGLDRRRGTDGPGRNPYGRVVAHRELVVVARDQSDWQLRCRTSDRLHDSMSSPRSATCSATCIRM